MLLCLSNIELNLSILLLSIYMTVWNLKPLLNMNKYESFCYTHLHVTVVFSVKLEAYIYLYV